MFTRSVSPACAPRRTRARSNQVASPHPNVIRGLDPRISEMAGSSPAMTRSHLIGYRSRIQASHGVQPGVLEIPAIEAEDRGSCSEGRRRAGETSNSGRVHRRPGGVFEFDPASPLRSDGLRGDCQEGLRGPEMARGKPRPLVFGVPPAAALVSFTIPVKIS